LAQQQTSGLAAGFNSNRTSLVRQQGKVRLKVKAAGKTAVSVVTTATQPKKQRSAYSAKLGAEIQRVASCIKTKLQAAAKQLKKALQS
jgi:uncharacterized protein involved in exopolysaccharide biosynthesis